MLGGPKKYLSFKKTRKSDSEINKFFEYFNQLKLCKLRDYTPWLIDERQYCSRLQFAYRSNSRTIYKEYKEYHSSLDNKKFMKIKALN